MRVNSEGNSTPTSALLRVIEVASTMRGLTVTAQVAVRLVPSVVTALISAFPSVRVVTLPLASTVATAVLLLLQASTLLVAFVGLTVAVIVNSSPASTSLEVMLKVSDVAGTGFAFTVTLQVALRLLPSDVTAEICTVPAVSAVTFPL